MPQSKRRRPGRPRAAAKYTPISLRIAPPILLALKSDARRRGIGYQTLMNRILSAYVALDRKDA